jgi:hypothetical protein
MKRKDLFIRAMNEYIERNGERLTSEDIEPIVLNLAYLEVLQARKLGVYIDSWEVLEGYAEAANEMIPNLNFNAELFNPGYPMTIEWDGLWEFLQQYFNSKLGWSIDDEELVTERFDSSSHTREEAGKFVSKSEVKRKVEFMFKNDKKVLVVRISETLSDKKALLESENGNKKVYRGTDPDYRFTIVYDLFGSIEEFILDVLPRKLRITYHE